VIRDNTIVELTPKLLDLLFHLLDQSGHLVTKEQLLDALWPGANVTDNALAQAVSELRQALADDAGAPQFIKTVARRGYRFIAPVDRIEIPSEQRTEASHRSAEASGYVLSVATDESIAVMDFANVSGDADSAWLSAGIAETVSGDLRALGRFRVVDRRRVAEAIRRTDGSLREVSTELGAPLAVVGSYQRQGDRIRITGRIVNVVNGEALADAKVDGPLSNIFELQDQVVGQFSSELGIQTGNPVTPSSSRETASLEAYRAFTEGWLRLEALDVRGLPQAIASFERAVAVDPRYALAYTGLASAQLAAYEATRSENSPAHEMLKTAIAHARRAVKLDGALAEAHATLALVLVSAWETSEAVLCARRAVALEPSNWRHFFRLGHASWGDERLRAAAATLNLYPDFAFAHFQTAMVHVARGHLREAEMVLRQGAAVQDRQIGRGERYPALGLHWLLGLVRLALDDVEEAIRELDRERELAEPHRLYGREYQMSALAGRGACLLRLGRHRDAMDSFREALALYPDHAQSHLGLALAAREVGISEVADSAVRSVITICDTLSVTRPIEAAIVRSQLLAVASEDPASKSGTTGNREAGPVLCRMLDGAPPGFAGWTLPIEPFLRELCGTEGLSVALSRLADRAR
jgi:DNA-binding winged helix-turn-helix (wHTH) protein/Tfp pilus assembly protein PilF